jgi:murein DD-endopeptidase MepM/ murein hydrolase activator NlpD
MHDGTIDRIADRGGRLSCIYIAGKDMTTVYAHLHIREKIALGMKVHQGELIGWVGRMLWDPHLHLEVWTNGKALSALTPALLAAKIDAIAQG